MDFDINQVPEEYREYVQKTVQAMQAHIDKRGDAGYKWSRDDFEPGAPLGRGKFGRVYLARERASGLMVALKVLYKKQLVDHHLEKQCIREIENQLHLHHPNVLQLLTYFVEESKLFLVLEYAAGGCLFDEMMKQPDKRFPQHLAAKYIYQVASALEYCHANSVIHRDLKPENLLLSLNGDIKLADFGWSVHTSKSRRATFCGTLDYLAPEIVAGEEYDKSVDQWCLGVLTYELLVGKPPFMNNEKKVTLKKIKNLEILWPPALTAGAKNLITKLLEKEGARRLPLSEVKEHFWIQWNIKNTYQ